MLSLHDISISRFSTGLGSQSFYCCGLRITHDNNGEGMYLVISCRRGRKINGDSANTCTHRIGSVPTVNP
jgi:hypothetical protein